VYIKGAVQGQGCWLSTDYDAMDLWVEPTPGVTSMNNLSIALSAWGPWLPVGPAPWAPRAAAALTPGHDGTYAILASGTGFAGGQPVEPTFGDVWRIDASVCLVSSVSFTICNGHGTPNLASVSCACEPGWAGRTCDNASPFTLLSANALVNVPDVNASFGPEDKARPGSLGRGLRRTVAPPETAMSGGRPRAHSPRCIVPASSPLAAPVDGLLCRLRRPETARLCGHRRGAAAPSTRAAVVAMPLLTWPL
jgi:hypothetical protein